ncbi:PadR family transcriptional regulator [Sphingomonas sp. TZW2008]|uniref:PadR family transcriptional regulator n=1 Tax=Sphingomonas sp. TZW2008 TaxID=1917973 RepID=UPI00211A7F91|nr:PadR family transcriptional regulator [Sphingomonas sp. TZW2008]
MSDETGDTPRGGGRLGGAGAGVGAGGARPGGPRAGGRAGNAGAGMAGTANRMGRGPRGGAGAGTGAGAAARAGAGAKAGAMGLGRGPGRNAGGGAAKAGAAAGMAGAGRARVGAGQGQKRPGQAGVAQRRKRMFDPGELRLVLLKLIGEEPRHGYDVIKSLEELTSGGYAPSPGVIYPTLTMLTEIGHVSSAEDGEGRKRFTITDAGRAHLDENGDAVGKLMARLSTFGERHQQGGGMTVRRAMMKLRSAVQDRLDRGKADDQIVQQIAALIDDSAKKIADIA